MKTTILNSQELLVGYDSVANLYPYIPSLSHWRAWEYAAYQQFQLKGRILDLGCGDGRYFRLIWPSAGHVIGVDMSQVAVDAGKESGVYRDVHLAPAHIVPEPDNSFDHVFANCSLEHMDHLDDVLSEINRCLKPGGTLLCSVVTNRFVEWSLLNNLISYAGFDEAAESLKKDFLDHHHLANPLTIDEWTKAFVKANLIPEIHIPIVPKHNSGLFLLMDSLWHVNKSGGGELGDMIYPFLSNNPNFPSAFRKIFEGMLEMETDWYDCSGAVFLIRKA